MMNFEQTASSADAGQLQQEQWSALYDGQLSAEQALALVNASFNDNGLMQQWRSMSAVGAVLREESVISAAPTASLTPIQAAPVQATLIQAKAGAAANDSRWKMVAGLASVAAVGSLVWGLLGGSGAGTGASQSAVLASNSVAVPVVNVSTAAAPAALTTNPANQAEAVMIRNPRLDEFLAAHKQFGGLSALQQPAGSLRSVAVSSSRP